MRILYADLVVEPVVEEAYKKKGAKPTKMNRAYKNYLQLEKSFISKLRSLLSPKVERESTMAMEYYIRAHSANHP